MLVKLPKAVKNQAENGPDFTVQDYQKNAQYFAFNVIKTVSYQRENVLDGVEKCVCLDFNDINEKSHSLE